MKQRKIKAIPLVEEYQIEFETRDGVQSAYFLGTKLDAKKHFEKMNRPEEPLAILKIEKVS